MANDDVNRVAAQALANALGNGNNEEHCKFFMFFFDEVDIDIKCGEEHGH